MRCWKCEKPINYISIWIGFIFVLIGCILLFFIENSHVKIFKKYDEAKSYVNVSDGEIFEENNGKLVTFTGLLSYDEKYLKDEDFNIVVNDTLYLRREVETCQYKEVSKIDSHLNKVYDYDKVWSKEYIDSGKFHNKDYKNTTKQYDDKIIYASNVKIGAFKVDKDELEQLNDESVLRLINTENYGNGYRVVDNYITNTNSMNHPEIGDVRIRYYYNENSIVSVFAKQEDGYLKPYMTKNGLPINYLIGGTMNGSTFVNMIRYEGTNEFFWTKVFCFMLNSLGMILVISPLYKSFSNSKIFGKLVGKSVELAFFCLGIGISIFIEAIPWLLYKPFVFLVLLVIVGVIFVFIMSMFFQKTDPFNVKVTEDKPLEEVEKVVIPKVEEKKAEITEDDGLNRDISFDDVIITPEKEVKCRKVKIVKKTTKTVNGKKEIHRKVVGTKMVPIDDKKKDS